MILAILLVNTETIKVELSKQSNGFDFGQAAPWLVALVALGFSVYQYIANTRIKRLEYLAGLAKEMLEDPLIQVATQMLDWEVRTIEFKGKKYVYSILMLMRALALHFTEGTFGPEFEETERLIRDAFDTLFNFTENMRYAVHLKVITQRDIYQAPLAYYLGKLWEKDAWTDGAICKYLEEYGFPKTKQLVRDHRKHRKRCAPKISALGEAQIAKLQQMQASAYWEIRLKKKETPTRMTPVVIETLAINKITGEPGPPSEVT
jgi:hypothetical protein